MDSHFDKNALLRNFATLGLGPTRHLMVHASPSAIGIVDGGAQTMVATLREVAGEAGSAIGDLSRQPPSFWKN